MSSETETPKETNEGENVTKKQTKETGKRKAPTPKKSADKAKSKSQKKSGSQDKGKEKSKSKSKSKAPSKEKEKSKSKAKTKSDTISPSDAMHSPTMRLFNKWFEQETTNGKQLSYNMCVFHISYLRSILKHTEDPSQIRCFNNKINALIKYVNKNIEEGKMLKKKRVEGTGEIVEKEFPYKDASRGTYTKRVWTGEWEYVQRRKLKPKRSGASKDKKKNVWTLAMERARKEIPELQESPGFVALRKTPPEPLSANPTEEEKKKHWQHKVGHALYLKTQELKPVLEEEQKANEEGNGSASEDNE